MSSSRARCCQPTATTCGPASLWVSGSREQGQTKQTAPQCRRRRAHPRALARRIRHRDSVSRLCQHAGRQCAAACADVSDRGGSRRCDRRRSRILRASSRDPHPKAQNDTRRAVGAHPVRPAARRRARGEPVVRCRQHPARLPPAPADRHHTVGREVSPEWIITNPTLAHTH